MYKGKSVAVVVPAYNEERQIGKVIETMPPFIDRIVIVDDCSRDATSEVVNRYRKDDQRIVLLRHEVNQGVGGGIATGYKWARDHDVDIAVVMAGDAQMDPCDLPRILDPVADGVADYSKANRLLVEDVYSKIPTVRLIGNSVLSLLTKIASGYWHISDSQTGYTAINRDALRVINWDRMYKRYGQPNDLLVKLNVHNFRVRDVTTQPVYHVGEKSKMRVQRVVFSISWLLVKLFFWRLKEKYVKRDFHPLVFFYLLGFFLTFCTFVLAVRLVVLWGMQGHVPAMTALASTFFATMSMQSIFFAMWFDMESNRHLR